MVCRGQQTPAKCDCVYLRGNLAEQAWCWHHYGRPHPWPVSVMDDVAPTLMTKVTLEERGRVIMRSQQLVHNIANDGAFNPLRAGTGMEKTSRHLSYLRLPPHFVSLTISVLGTVSRDISSHNTVNDEIWKICLNGFTPRSLLLSRSSLCEPWGLSLITPDAEVLRLSWH